MRVAGRPDERGSGTVLALAATAILLMVLVAGLALASAVVAAHRARAGADLAALAAATAVQGGATTFQACHRASVLAAANAAEQAACTVRGDGSVTVATTARVGFALPGIGYPRARATARAGPAPSL